MKKSLKELEIQFSETNFKYYKDHQLEIDVSVEQIESVSIIRGYYYSSLNYGYYFKKIEIELREKEKFQLTITRKKAISRFSKFAELLQQYCSEKKIQYSEVHKDINYYDKNK